jgi:peptidoglycan/LPS O-acetylase OafA/YrhL
MAALQTIQGYLAPLDALGRQTVAWIGSALLLVGIFLPAKSVSVLGFSTSVSYWDYSKLDSFVLFLLAAASAGLAYIMDFRWLWVTGVASVVFVLLLLVSTLGEAFVSPSWAFLVLFLGALAILAAAAMKPDPNQAPKQDVMTLINNMMNRR